MVNLILVLKVGELDVIVIVLFFVEFGLVVQLVYEELFCVVVLVVYLWVYCLDVDVDEFDGENLLLFGQGNCFCDQVLEFCLCLMVFDVFEYLLEGSLLEIICYMVVSGVGVVVMLSMVVDLLIDKELMVKVLLFVGNQFKCMVGLVWWISFL